MSKFVPDHLKTKRICKHAVRKLLYLLRYVPEQYKTQQICDKAILKNGGINGSFGSPEKSLVLTLPKQTHNFA